MSHCNSEIDTKRGFTLVEMLVVMPIIILAIGIFINVIVYITGGVLVSRGANALVYNIQDALNRIEEDVKSSSNYLATNSISLTSPQGYNNDGTSNFHNASATTGTMLILNTYATTSNPITSTRNIIYSNGPNPCGSNLVNLNQPITLNIVYFVKDNTLWRRVVAPANYATVGCSVPWQRPSCYPGISGVFCKAQDVRLVDGVGSSGFNISYYSSPSSTTADSVSSDNTKPDSDRQTTLQTISTIGVTITATNTIAGHDVTQTGTIRVSALNE
jgi:competence protein ComGC